MSLISTVLFTVIIPCSVRLVNGCYIDLVIGVNDHLQDLAVHAFLRRLYPYDFHFCLRIRTYQPSHANLQLLTWSIYPRICLLLTRDHRQVITQTNKQQNSGASSDFICVVCECIVCKLSTARPIYVCGTASVPPLLGRACEPLRAEVYRRIPMTWPALNGSSERSTLYARPARVI